MVDGGQRSTQFLADIGGFTGAETSGSDTLFQCLSFYEVHPEADPAVMTVGAMNHDDVRVPDAHELAGLVQNLWGRRAVGDLGLEELQRSGVIQPGVERFIHLAVCAFADFPNEEEMAPALRWLPVDSGSGQFLRKVDRGSDCFIDLRAMDFCHARDDTELIDKPPKRVVACHERADGVPVDRLAISDRCTQLAERVDLATHTSVP